MDPTPSSSLTLGDIYVPFIDNHMNRYDYDDSVFMKHKYTKVSRTYDVGLLALCTYSATLTNTIESITLRLSKLESLNTTLQLSEVITYIIDSIICPVYDKLFSVNSVKNMKHRSSMMTMLNKFNDKNIEVDCKTFLDQSVMSFNQHALKYKISLTFSNFLLLRDMIKDKIGIVHMHRFPDDSQFEEALACFGKVEKYKNTQVPKLWRSAFNFAMSLD